MSPERWKKVNQVFQDAVELEPDEQKIYLGKACADDDSLLQQVETLLAADDEAGTFIVGNAAKDVAHLVATNDPKTITGESLGHYEIISILGSGGMGKVYLAKDSKLNRSIAVKTLPNSFSNQSDHIKRFQTEAKAAANLNHPNVATVYSVEETDDNQTFITMEYVEGKPLSEIISSNGLNQRTFLEMFISIADALAHAHEKGIVHRDIKPSNIMITPNGNPKILDFGLAQIDKTKITEDASTLRLTKTGQVLGTPAYMSPEQAEGKESDHRTDIFSLGVLMYQALTGQRPFKGDNYATIVGNLLNQEPKNITEIKPDAPYLLSRLIMKCLSKEPRFRYQSMNEVRVILKEIDSALLSGAALSRPNQKVISNPKSVPIWAFVSLISILALVSGFAVWKGFQGNSFENHPITKLNFQSPTGDSTDLLSARISPDGKNFVVSESDSHTSRLLLRPLDKFETKIIEGSEGAGNPIFSPDGKWIIYWENGKNIKKLPVKGGVPQTLCDSCAMSQGADWGENNLIVFSDSLGIHRLSSNGGEVETVTKIDKKAGEKYHRYPDILPGGKNVIFTVDVKGKTSLAIVSLETKEITYLEGTEKGWYPKYVPTGHLLFSRKKQLYAVGFDLAQLKIIGKPKVVLNGVFDFLPDVQITNNGTLVYLPATTGKGNSLVWLDKNGKATQAFERKANYYAPRISPDNKKVAIVIDSNIWVLEIETQKQIRLTFEGENSYPVWAPDGKSIVFGRQTTNNEWIIYQKNADGTGHPKKIYSSNSTINPYSIHPTEEIVAFSSFPDSGKGEIMVASLVDGKARTVVSSRVRLDIPRFSPNGKWLSYYSTESGTPQVFVQSWEGSNERFLISQKSGVSPVWSKTGSEIFYRQGQNFYSTKIQTSPNFQNEESEFLFKGSYRSDFDVSQDGTKFLAVKSTGGVFPKHLNIVSNWTRELKDIMKSTE